MLADRLRANQEGFLEHLDLPSLLRPFNQKAKGDSGNIVEGEFAGRFLQAASGAYEYRHDPQLKELMDKVASQLLAAQAKNGYFGAYSNGERWTGSDLLVHRWTLAGLLNYWRVTGEEDAYTSCQLLGDLLVKTWGHKGEYGAQLGKNSNVPLRLAALQTVGPLTALYRYTADPDYLDLGKFIVGAIDLPSVLSPPSSAEELSGTLLGLSGLADLYRITGDKSYLLPVVSYWKSTAARHLLLTGAPALSSDVDNCVTAAWMQLTLDLFRITGEPQYGQQLERTVYNQLLAAQDMETGNIAAAVPLAGKKNFSSKLLPDTGRCMLSEAEGLALIPQVIWGRYPNGVLVNLYTAGRVTVELRRRGVVQIYSETSFPEAGDALLHVEPSHNLQFSLALRVPDWASSFTAEVAGQRLVGKRGELVIFNREWKRGDTVRVSMVMGVRLVEGTDEASGRLAIGRGPQILALGKTLNPQLDDLGAAGVLLDAGFRLTLSPMLPPLAQDWAGDQIYKTAGEYQGKKQILVLVPFADALNCQVWLKKPNVAPMVEE